MPPRTPLATGAHTSSSGSRSEDRRTSGRRASDRRSAGDSLDVSRIEHENLTKQVGENVRAIQRIEHEIRRLRERLDALTGGARAERKG